MRDKLYEMRSQMAAAIKPIVASFFFSSTTIDDNMGRIKAAE
jgi:hypothetical protein